MLKTLSAYIGEYKKVSIKTPIYIIVEVLMEILIPFVTASIIDKGIQAGDMSKVLMYGGLMLVHRRRFFCASSDEDGTTGI